MIYTEGTYKPVIGVFKMEGTKEIPFTALYIGDRLFWQAVRSCFGTGTWISAKPWIGDDKWKNNK